MESNQTQAETAREGSVGFEIAPVLFPGAVGNDAAGAANRFHGGVIFANGRDHAGNELDSIQRAESADVSPDFGIRADGIERDLQTRHLDLLHAVGELSRILRLQRPTANGEGRMRRRGGAACGARAQADTFGGFDELDKAASLGAKSIEEFGSSEFSLWIEQVVDLGQENAFGI